MRRLIPLLAVVGLTVAACGDQPLARTTTNEPSPGPDQRYTATATVLESPDHGPQLCLGGVADSLPPQCGGPDITNWDWNDVEAATGGGTTWGDYRVVGTYDGTRFTLTEPPEPPGDRWPGGFESVGFGTPCAEPSGGWQVVDPQMATDEAMNSAIEYAYAQPDHSGIWMDQSINPALSDSTELTEGDLEGVANDPTKLILNFSFTGDLDRHERELRALWGGALCVSLAERTEAELTDIQLELHDEMPELLGSGIDSVTGTLYVNVVVDDGSLQRSLDDRYGDGVVRVDSALQPVE